MYIFAVVHIFLNLFLPLSEKPFKNPCSFEPISTFLAATVFCYGFGINPNKCIFGLKFLALRLFFFIFS